MSQAASAPAGALVVFAKQPRPGHVKTRLCPPFSPDEAADLYAAMLDDVLEASAQMAEALGLKLFVALDPPEAVAAWRDRLGPTVRVEAQRGDGLAPRMESVCAARFGEGLAPLLLRGSDSPTLGRATAEAALRALDTHDVVLCPDRDGGYNLVGLRRPLPGLFDHPMSTASVLEDTAANAQQLGARVHRLPAGFDIDTAADLALLAKARRGGAEKLCPRTLEWLDRHNSWGTPASDQSAGRLDS